jgi:hypothetical protein
MPRPRSLPWSACSAARPRKRCSGRRLAWPREEPVRIPQPLLDVGLDDLARRKAARGLQRPLATPLEVTRPCLAVRQDGIDVNGRNIAFGAAAPGGACPSLGLGGHPDSPEPLDMLSSDGARPREHRQGTGIRASGPRSRVGRPISGHRVVGRLELRADRVTRSRNTLETARRTVLLLETLWKRQGARLRANAEQPRI